MPQWSVQESVIDDLRISNIPRQPKYSYLIGKAAQQKDDFWRKSNASNIVNNNQYTRPPPSTHQEHGAANVPNNSSSYFLPQHNSSSSKRLNDFHSSTNHSGTNATNNVQSAAYEDRINTALRKAPSGSAAGVGAATNSSVSSAVQKSKSYSNFDFVRRDLNFQVCTQKCYLQLGPIKLAAQVL